MAITSKQDSREPLVVPSVDVSNTGGEDVSSQTHYENEVIKTVQIGAGFKQVQLPNGFAYDAGDEVELSQWEFDQITAESFSLGVVTDITA